MRTPQSQMAHQGVFLGSFRLLRYAGGLGAAALLLASCTPAAPPPEPVRAVKLVTVGVGALQAHQDYSGEVRARTESRLGFRVAGKIVKRQAELGQRVLAGQVLAQLDPQDYQLAASAAQAQVSAAQTQHDLASADFQRFAALKAQNFISGAELDRREASLKATKATLAQARAQASAQGNQATYTRLVADVDGVVTGIDAEVGQVVSAGTPVLRIAQDGARDVVFAVSEDKVTRLQVGQAVTVRSWSGGETLQARVREVAASADPVTRTYAVKASIEAGQAPPLGATVHVTPEALSAAGVPAIKLPTTALRQEGVATAVWVYEPESGTVRSQVVQVATADGNEAVIADGLVPGMQVVSTGVHVLTPGQRVGVYELNSAQALSSKAQATTENVVPKPSAPSASATR